MLTPIHFSSRTIVDVNFYVIPKVDSSHINHFRTEIDVTVFHHTSISLTSLNHNTKHVHDETYNNRTCNHKKESTDKGIHKAHIDIDLTDSPLNSISYNASLKHSECPRRKKGGGCWALKRRGIGIGSSGSKEGHTKAVQRGTRTR